MAYGATTFGAAGNLGAGPRQIKNERASRPAVATGGGARLSSPNPGGGASGGVADALKSAFQTMWPQQQGGGGGLVQQGSIRGGGVQPVDPRLSSPNPGGPGGPGTTWTAQPPTTFTNTAGTDPGLQAAVARYNERTQQQQQREGAVDPNLQKQIDRLDESLSTDETDRMVNRTTSQARDQLAGIKSGAQSSLARSGGNPYGQGNLDSRLASAAARASAGAAANVQMGERARKDSLILGGQNIMAAPGQERLIREGRTDELVRGGIGANMAPANLALDQQRFGLDQWRAGDESSRDRARIQNEAEQGRTNSDLARQRQTMDQFQMLLRSAGY